MPVRLIVDDRRRALLTAALGFLQLPPRARELVLLHRWLDNWRGGGLIIDGMSRHGYRVSLRNVAVDSGWVCSFQLDPMTSRRLTTQAASSRAARQMQLARSEERRVGKECR